MRVVRVDGDPARVLADEDAHDAARLARSRGGVDRRGSSLVEVHLDDEVRGGCHRPAHVAPLLERDHPPPRRCSTAPPHGTPTTGGAGGGGSRLIPRFLLMVGPPPPAVPSARLAR